MIGDTEQKNSFEYIEHSSLRLEILVRVLVQNMIIISAIVLFNLTLVAMIVVRRDAGLLALAYCFASGAGALGWCHNGVRQAQIKSYLLEIEARMSTADGWESWLPRNRIGGFLGTRWFIATKGFFIASQIVAAGMSLAIMANAAPTTYALLVLSIAATAVILLINPKESGSATLKNTSGPSAG